MDKSMEKKDGSTRFPTLRPETMTVGSENPRESLEEGGGVKSRIALMSIRGKDVEKPSKPIPETSVFGPVRPQETEEKDEGAEESCHDAREEGCEMDCETVDEGTREQPDRGPARPAVRAVWDAIQPWFVGPRLVSV